MRWAIVYDDLSVSRGEGEAAFAAARADGVQFVVWEDGRVHYDHDAYWYRDGMADQTNDLGPLMRRLGIKFGRTTSAETFERARAMAAAERKAMES